MVSLPTHNLETFGSSPQTRPIPLRYRSGTARPGCRLKPFLMASPRHGSEHTPLPAPAPCAKVPPTAKVHGSPEFMPMSHAAGRRTVPGGTTAAVAGWQRRKAGQTITTCHRCRLWGEGLLPDTPRSMRLTPQHRNGISPLTHHTFRF